MNLPQPKVVLLACGSFNPVTNMHLRMFELAKDHLNKLGKYKVISGIMSPVSDGYEKKGLVASKHRCDMVQLAAKTSDWIKLDTWESEQNTWTETRKVLEHHQNVLNSAENDFLTPTKRSRVDDSLSGGGDNRNTQNRQVQLKLLCGADLLESFAKPGLWKDEDITEIVSKYGLVVISREGSNPHKFIYESDVLSKYQNNIFIVTEWITNEISATKIRRALSRGESVKYLIQDSVIDYINLHGLYGSANNKYSSVMLTPSPNQDVDFLDRMGNITGHDEKHETRGVCMPRIMDIICLANSKAQQGKNSALSTLV